MNSSKRLFLGQILMKRGLVAQKDIDEALHTQKTTKEYLGIILIRKGLITEGDLLDALSVQLGVPFGSIKDFEIDWGLARRLPKSLIVEHRCFPIAQTPDAIVLAISNPLDVWAITETERLMPGYRVQSVLVASSEMDILLDKYRSSAKDKLRKLLED